MNQKGVAPILILVAVIGIVAFLAISSSAPFKNNFLSSLYPKEESHAAAGDQSGTTFVETFTGFPNAPLPWDQTAWQQRWDIAIHSRDANTWDLLQPMLAHHGADCSVPVNSTNPGNPVLVTHQVGGSYSGSVFNCRDHMMTALFADEYGLIVLTPNHMVDFSQGEATIRWDMATYRSSARDWVDFWISPYADNLTLPLCCGFPDLQGNPKNGVVFKLEGGEGGIVTNVVRNLVDGDDLPTDWEGIASIVPASAARRDTFEIKISKTHLQMCLISANYSAANVGPQGQTSPVQINHCFANHNIASLGWDKGVFQISHHSYTPDKDCGTPNPPISCSYNTWHWDNVSIAPAIPFTIIKANKRIIKDVDADKSLTFNSPAPANSNLRFAAIGRIEYSLNNGTTWQVAAKQPAKHTFSDNPPNSPVEHFASYFVPIPQGTQNVKFRFSADGWYDTGFDMAATDFAIWSTTTTGVPSPTPIPTPSPSAAPSVAPSPSPSPVPSASSKPGDIDGNNKVDIFDYNILLTNFGKTGTGIQGDFDKNGKVDIFDFNVLLTNFGK